MAFRNTATRRSSEKKHTRWVAHYLSERVTSLTARPWAERGSCSARDLFFFVVFNRAAMGRARFLLYTGFIINRAAMGRARFLFYTGFIINRAAMGRARFLLTARPWAERGSCFTRDLLLTARPWAERGSCFARDLLLLLFFFFCIFFVGDQTQTSTRPNRDRDLKSPNL